MYKQTLYKIIDNHIKPKIIKRLNRYNKWKYGYNKEHDIIVISKTGEIGEIYEIQNLKIALPKPTKVYSRSKKKQEQYYFMVINQLKPQKILLEQKYQL